MALPKILSKLTAKEKTPEPFLAIEIGSETVTTAVWHVVNGQTQIVSLGTTEEWEQAKEVEDSLLGAIDASLEKAVSQTETEPNKVIFGLQEGWVEDQSIARPYTKILKKVTEKFEFEPIGFVVTTEALVHFLKRQEGTPPTAILIRVNESEIQATLVNIGKIVGTQTVARSEDIGADVEEGLARFEKQENFPSRMLLVNSTMDLETLKQDLLSYNWLEKLPFLHFPKVEVMEKQAIIKAVAIAGGSEAAKALGFKVDEEEKEKKEEEERKEEQEPQPETAERAPEQRADEKDEAKPASVIGFATGEEIEEPEALPTPQEKEVREEPPPKPETTSPEPPRERGSWIQGIGRIIRRLRLTVQPSFPKALFPLNLGSRVKVSLVVTGVFFLTLTAAGIYGYWTIPKATVTIYVKPRTLEKELLLTVDPQARELNAEQFILPGKLVEKEVEKAKTKATTGKKLVGDRAKGEVTIYNKTSVEKTFPAGSILVGPNNLKFSLDSQANIASASSQETEGGMTTTYGKGKVAVTAAAIGAQYNFPANTESSIQPFSTASYSGKNENPIAGGTSREVQAIAQKDVDDLTKEITAELKEQAVKELEEEGGGKRVLSEGAKTLVLDTQHSGNVGDEANELTLTVKLKVTSIAYAENEYASLLLEGVRTSIPEGYQLQAEESNPQITASQYTDDIAQLTILYKAMLVPTIDTEALKREIRGKYPELVASYFSELPNFSEVEVRISPAALPQKLKTFPRKTENITIEVKVEP